MSKEFIPRSKPPTRSFRAFKNILPEKEHGFTPLETREKRELTVASGNLFLTGFTLIELIIVIVLVGILAAIGITQYSLMVEKSRTAEAKVRIGAMRTLAYQYYLENGTLIGMQNADVGVNNTCSSTDFYAYWTNNDVTYAHLIATRCTSGGKTPDASRAYYYYFRFYPGTGQSGWYCYYLDDSSPCFGLPVG